MFPRRDFMQTTRASHESFLFFRFLSERFYSITIADIATDGQPILGPACYYRRPLSLYDPESRRGAVVLNFTERGGAVNSCVNL